jgi:hypothetical protein
MNRSRLFAHLRTVTLGLLLTCTTTLAAVPGQTEAPTRTFRVLNLAHELGAGSEADRLPTQSLSYNAPGGERFFSVTAGSPSRPLPFPTSGILDLSRSSPDAQTDKTPLARVRLPDTGSHTLVILSPAAQPVPGHLVEALAYNDAPTRRGPDTILAFNATPYPAALRLGEEVLQIDPGDSKIAPFRGKEGSLLLQLGLRQPDGTWKLVARHTCSARPGYRVLAVIHLRPGTGPDITLDYEYTPADFSLAHWR